MSFPGVAGAMAGSDAPVFREVNITGEEFVVIQNLSSQPLNLGDYWLGYSSDAGATAGPSEQLPAVTLGEHETLVLSNGPVDTCGAAAAGDLPFSLSNSNGELALWQFHDNPASFSLTGGLVWDKNSATGSDYLNLDSEDQAEDYAKQNNQPSNISWLKPLPSAAQPNPDWQVGNLVGCAFTPVDDTAQPGSQQSINWPASYDYPPFTMLPSKISGSGSGPVLPASDVGLKAPMINELLPNPAKPQTDDQDEFIELYNPNSRGFDLSGFQLEMGSTTSSRRHNYKFPPGTKIEAKSFRIFKSGNTSVSLTNGGGQVWLLDPFGKTISKSGVYGEAKDGLAFAMAGGKWYWTFLPTPGEANTIQQPGGETAGGSGSSGKTATVNGKPITAVKAASTTSSGGDSSSFGNAATATPVHPWTLAAVVAVALLYGAYEYRHDLGNKLYQLKRYREARRGNRPKA